MKLASLFALALTATLAIAAPQRNQQQPASDAVVSPPSLGEAAQQAKAQQEKSAGETVPLYTNDNLPKEGGGISVLGPSGSSAGHNAVALSARENLAKEQEMAYLRAQLSRLQQHAQLHQRELAVLQQQESQTSMEWSPNPNETLRQEYSRQNVNNLARQIDQKRQQLSQDQTEIQTLQDQLARDQASFGWLSQGTPPGSESPANTEIPPDLKPGTPEYWQARIQAAQQKLATAKERQSLATNELSLLKLQQLRSLDPNVQARLAINIPSKQAELAADAQAVQQAQQELAKLQAQAQADAAKSH